MLSFILQGEYKRTLTMLLVRTPIKGREKFVEDLEKTHALFKEFVVRARPVVDIEQVATGEIWYGSQAIAKQLVDELSTSDSYLMNCLSEYKRDVYHVSWEEKKSLPQKFGIGVQTALLIRPLSKWLDRILIAMRFPG